MTRVFFDTSSGKLMEHDRYAVRLYWSPQMLADLKRHFPTTRNEECAEMLGVSVRTLVRKAREVGIEKDPHWIKGVWNHNRLMAQASTRLHGNLGCFKKGVHYNPAGEFKKGHISSRRVRILDMTTGTIYESGVECAKALSVTPTRIYACLKSGKGSHGHVLVRYKEEETSEES